MSTNASDTVRPTNPANAEAKPKHDRIRIPMSTPTRSMEVPEIPGYHCHWIKEENVPRAIQAWYEFVQDHEVPVNQRSVGTDKNITGNTDMGTNISLITGTNGKRSYLMKLKEELWLEDRKKLDALNAGKLQAIFRGETILSQDPEGKGSGNTAHRYVDPDRTYHRPALFNRARPKV